MRNKFEEQLEQLNIELIEMGSMCEQRISDAIKALTSHNMELAKMVMEKDSEIDQKEREIESLCLKMLLQQQPVARDLRLISSALKMITDMERIGDQAADIAEIVSMANISVEDLSNIVGMGEATMKMVTDSIDAYVRKDLELAKHVIDYDDVVDEYFIKVKKELISFISNSESDGEFAVDLLMIAKYFERIGDHATNIAEWVEFSITGKHKGS
ncbi:phosphate signaling complex protein PhoU [Candidatus Galacturonibacter soehngenii]|uniref:Phosphate-specific transport system accessory protein PhoU n=1 Tax=Candidatus Galacturonatibacter soehngenii TaxID=2307010 RepID=A0A7V7UB83_9FIRM|nr:phosphate signaling complex protein PhoU [Candidatus Galacturonibacter soehngenii]KAB1437505.1 phosphate signaling complex protein PhoU [Candidatus Galacturonibacter soehngenii]MBA4688442.1 phosphate signaling complex protein PhoU [Candidatus Galacturonibacter soehngenii]